MWFKLSIAQAIGTQGLAGIPRITLPASPLCVLCSYVVQTKSDNTRNSPMSFEVKTPLFEGPFDLLLFFIRRDELDIHDIPISKITKDFLDYLHHLDKMNVEVASEFILMASTLMRIKAKMLLPRVELDEEGEEIDPRAELVQHLMEYKRYKSVLEELQQMEEGVWKREKRGNLQQELKTMASLTDVEAELQDLDLYKLLKAYQGALRRFEEEQAQPTHKVKPYPYTITEQKAFLLQKLRQYTRLSFQDVIAYIPDRIAVIFNFLAILELMQLGQASIQLGEGFNNFWIIKPEEKGESMGSSETAQPNEPTT